MKLQMDAMQVHMERLMKVVEDLTVISVAKSVGELSGFKLLPLSKKDNIVEEEREGKEVVAGALYYKPSPLEDGTGRSEAQTEGAKLAVRTTPLGRVLCQYRPPVWKGLWLCHESLWITAHFRL